MAVWSARRSGCGSICWTVSRPSRQRKFSHVGRLRNRSKYYNLVLELNFARFFADSLILLRQEIASSDVTVDATLREHFLGETGHERGPAATVHGLCRGACRGDWARGSGGAVA